MTNDSFCLLFPLYRFFLVFPCLVSVLHVSLRGASLPSRFNADFSYSSSAPWAGSVPFMALADTGLRPPLCPHRRCSRAIFFFFPPLTTLRPDVKRTAICSFSCLLRCFRPPHFFFISEPVAERFHNLHLFFFFRCVPIEFFFFFPVWNVSANLKEQGFWPLFETAVVVPHFCTQKPLLFPILSSI